MRMLRCLGVLAAVSALALLTGRLLWPSVITPATRFDEQLVRVCSLALLGCLAWSWLSVATLVAQALGSVRWALPGTPVVVRRTVLAACGVAVLAGGPAMAAGDVGLPAGPQVAVGLPFPGRAMDDGVPAAPTPVPTVAPAVTTSQATSQATTRAMTQHDVVVRAGDSLWAIAVRRLPPGAADHQVAAAWQQIYDLNRDVIGDDPSLIHPGQRLMLPDTLGR